MILPPVAHGVKVISIGMFVEGSTAVSWRGPMLHRTMQQFLTDVFFGDLDVLLLDMPPGTGDIAISLGQLLPHAEVLVVTTPQPAAAEVAERSGLVARQTGQPVDRRGREHGRPCSRRHGARALRLRRRRGGCRALSTPESQVPVLASIPLSVAAARRRRRRRSPLCCAHPDDPAAAAILRLAEALARRVHGGSPGDNCRYSSLAPNFRMKQEDRTARRGGADAARSRGGGFR